MCVHVLQLRDVLGKPSASQLKHHARAEPADVVAGVLGLAGGAVEACYFFHDQAGFGGLGVGDVDGVAAMGRLGVDLGQFLGEGAG